MSYYGNVNVYGVPELRNYAQAVKHEASIKPIRGTVIKPLGQRHKKWVNIMRLDDGTVAIQCHGADLIRYKKNGQVWVNFTSGMTERAYMRKLLGSCVSVYRSLLWVKLSGKTYRVDGWMKLICNDGRWTLHRPKKLDTYTLGKKKYAEIRKQYQPFVDYVRGIWKLRREDVDTPVASHWWLTERHRKAKQVMVANRYGGDRPKIYLYGTGNNSRSRLVTEFFRLVDSHDGEENYKAFKWLVNCTPAVPASRIIEGASDHAFLMGDLTGKFWELVRYQHKDEIYKLKSYVPTKKTASSMRVWWEQ